MGAADDNANAAGVTVDDRASVHETVVERTEDKGEAQNRQWDSEDRDGGSTIVLSNQNSIEAHEQKRPYSRVLQALSEQKREQAREAAQARRS